MYLMKLDEQQVKSMWLIREELKKYGIKKPITVQVRETIKEYINKSKKSKK